MIKKIISLMLCICLISCNNEKLDNVPDESWDADWQFLTLEEDGRFIFLDNSSLKKSGSIISYWILSSKAGNPYSEKRTLTQFEENCEAQQWRISRMIIYGVTVGPIASGGVEWAQMHASLPPHRRALHDFACSS